MMERRDQTASLRRVVAALAVVLAALIVSSPTGATGSADPTARIVIAGKAVPVAVAPYRDATGNIRCSVDFVSSMGAGYLAASSGDSVAITRNGRTQVFPCHVLNDHAVVSISPIVQSLGGVLDWDARARTATILARIRMVREDSNHLIVATGFPVTNRVGAVEKPNRVYVDVHDAYLGGPATTIPSSGDDVDSIRATQMDAATVRIVVDLKKPLAYQVVSSGDAGRIDVALVSPSSGGDSENHASPAKSAAHLASVPSGDGDAHHNSAAGVDSSQTSPPTQNDKSSVSLSRSNATAHIVAIDTDASVPGELHTSITVAGSTVQPYHAFLLDFPNRLVFDVPNADFSLTGDLAGNTADSMPMVNAIVKAIRWGITDMKARNFAGRVVFDLYRTGSYTISTTDLPDGSEQYTINLLLNKTSTSVNEANASSALPPVAPVPVISQPLVNVPDSVLTGKTIVVDPGHGGYDGGAPGVHGLWEKSITLAVGKALRDQLVACGARVVMTRADDTFVELKARAQMGIDNHADYYVSIHADSSGGRNSHSGSTVYYHSNNAACESLASAIASRLGQLNDGIPSLGVRSDYVRFPNSGFSVLRHSPEPAVLVETGYVNSDHDAAVLTDPAIQKLIAQGIVAGLKDFAVQISRSASVSAQSSDGDTDRVSLVARHGAAR